MHFTPHAADTPLPGNIQKRGDEVSADAFAAPLIGGENCDDVHDFATELRTPWIGSVGISAKAGLVFRNEYGSEIARLHNSLEHTPRVFRRALSSNLHEKLGCEFAEFIHVGRRGRADAEGTRTCRCHTR